MFKFLKNAGNSNKVWGLLNEKYFKSLDGKIGGTVLKIKEGPASGYHLFIQTDSESVRKILIENESRIISDINNELGISLTGMTIL